MRKESKLFGKVCDIVCFSVVVIMFSFAFVESLTSPDCNRESRDCVVAHLLWSDTQEVFYLAGSN